MANEREKNKTVPIEKGHICENCFFWEVDKGLCHRYAPRPGDSSMVKNTVWPATIAEDFCGEFQDKRPVRAGGGFMKQRG